MPGAQKPSHSSAKRLSWQEAPLALLAMIRAKRSVGAPVLVGVTGPVGSGKSSLARRLGGVTLRTDDYLPDYKGLPERERDLPERADLARLADNLASLRAGRAALAPVWCFHEHRRIGERTIDAGELIVCEGIHALHASLVEHYEIRVFVDAPRGVRWERWRAIEQQNQRGWGVERARAFFENVAEPTFGERAPGYRAAAHVIVVNDRGDTVEEDRS